MITGVVIGLLLLGILLILVEILFVPGTTIVGIGGVILLGIGVYMAYAMISTQAGHLSLAGSVVLVFILLIVFLKSGTWERFALDGSLEGRANDDADIRAKVGDKGKTISRLNPVGKASFGDEILEVAVQDGFVDPETDVVISKKDRSKIIVKPIIDRRI